MKTNLKKKKLTKTFGIAGTFYYYIDKNNLSQRVQFHNTNFYKRILSFRNGSTCFNIFKRYYYINKIGNHEGQSNFNGSHYKTLKNHKNGRQNGIVITI